VAPRPTPAIELVKVVKRFGSERVLDDVSFEVPTGAITVLLGPSGAGKTVTIKHVLGLFQPTSGRVRVEGHDLSEISDDELNQVRRRMSVVLQGALPFSCGLFFSMDVFENVAFALRERRPRWTEKQVEQVTMDNLELVGLRPRAHSMPSELSAGMCKRAALARAFALESPIVVIDDFDSGIDGVRLALLCDLIGDSQRASRATYLVSTHDMSAARKLADHAAVIHDGRIVASGAASAVLGSSEPVVSQLVGGKTSGPLGMSPGL
jgi:phospholipid/cholesterol/gamma-HCH transport system ATP-binding protein